MQRWKCCSSWSKQNPKHFSNTGFPQGKPVFFSAYIFLAPEWPEGKGRRAYGLSFLWRILWSDRTKRVGKKCSLHRNGWGKGRGAYGLFFLWRALYERGAELIEWRSAQKRSGMSGLFCPEIFGILNIKKTVCTVCTEGGIR